MGAMALMAARPRLDALGVRAERSLTRPENFISRAQKNRAIRAGRMQLKARAISQPLFSDWPE